MKYFVFFIFIFIISCKNNLKDCSNFKTGTFKYTNSEYQEWTVTRNDSIQIEISNKDNTKLIASIEWLSNCQYVITYKETINYFEEGLIGKKIKVNITETFDNSYKCIAKSDIGEMNLRMIRIN